ncbi:MAG: phosphopyruvate hydratase [Candidatus Paceibacterota bacterium]
MIIKNIEAREILDSRGNPTVEVELTTEAGVFYGKAPSGASTGKYEALELRDEGDRYHGKGVKQAIENVNEIASELEGKEVSFVEADEKLIKMDSSNDKSELGANAILPVSIAACKAEAASRGISVWQLIADEFDAEAQIPRPSFNIINGGTHAGNGLDIQEFMILPSEEDFKEQIRKASEVYHTLKKILKNKFDGLATNVGDEGGFAPPLRKTDTVLDLIGEAIERNDYNMDLGLDSAASEFYQKEEYNLEGTTFTQEGLLKFYEELIEKYDLISIEDPFAEEDWEGFMGITDELGSEINIVGDDLLASNAQRVEEANNKGACNTLLLKPNQVGTITEAIKSAQLAQSFGWEVMVSHRSGETCDPFIADLAVGIGADYIKAGAPARGERVAKYNQLLRIEEEL